MDRGGKWEVYFIFCAVLVIIELSHTYISGRMKIIKYSSNPLNIPAPANPLHRQIHDEIYKSMLKLHGLEQSEGMYATGYYYILIIV